MAGLVGCSASTEFRGQPGSVLAEHPTKTFLDILEGSPSKDLEMKTIKFRWVVSGLVAIAMAVALYRRSRGSPQPRRNRKPKPHDAFQRQVLPLLERYCVDCHMNEDSEAGIVLDRFDNQEAAVKDGRTWIRVRDALQGRIMPPADEPQPSLEELDRIVAWIENDFLAAQCGKQVSSAPVVIRRLNRQEYNNTIRDLLGLDLHLADGFPAGRYRIRFRQRRLRAQHLARPHREVSRRRRARPAEGDRLARRRGILARRADRPEDVSAPAEQARSSSSTP